MQRFDLGHVVTIFMGLVQGRVTFCGVKVWPALPRNPCSEATYVQSNAVARREKCYPGSVRFEPGLFADATSTRPGDRRSAGSAHRRGPRPVPPPQVCLS